MGCLMSKGITENDVFSTADQLLADGQRPTIERVRQALGRGSPNTVNRHLDAWWAQLSTRVQIREDSQQVPAPVLRLAEKLWTETLAEARQQAREELDAAQKSLEEQGVRLAAERDEFARLQLAQQQHVTALESDVQSTRAELQAARAEISDLRQLLQAVTEQRREAESSAEKSRAQLEIAQREHAAELEKLSVRHEAAERRIADRLGELMAEHDRLKRRSTAQIDRLTEDLAAERGKTSDARLQIGTLEEQIAGLNAQLGAERHAAEMLRALAKQPKFSRRFAGARAA